MLNLVTGTFVQSAQENMREIQDMDLVDRVKEICMSTDHNQSGTITWKEFERQLRTPQMAQYLKAIDLHHSEARLLYSLLDVQNEDAVSADDFVNGCLRLQGPAKAIDHAIMSNNLRSMFRWHLEQGGYIEAQLSEIGERLGKLDQNAMSEDSTSESDSDEVAHGSNFAARVSRKRSERSETLQTMTVENVFVAPKAADRRQASRLGS